MKPIHILAGLVALAAGAIALAASKGSPLHRLAGRVFVLAMVVMTTSAVGMALFVSPNRVNVVAGTLTFYLVASGLLTVRRTLEQVRGATIALMATAFAVGVYALVLAGEAMGNADGLVDKVPAPALLMFATVGLLGAALDARLLRAGGIQGAHRIARHLWRMGFALWIATMSFFLGQAKVFPAVVRESGLLVVPVLLVTAALAWSLARVLLKRHRALRARGFIGG